MSANNQNDNGDGTTPAGNNENNTGNPVIPDDRASVDSDASRGPRVSITEEEKEEKKAREEALLEKYFQGEIDLGSNTKETPLKKESQQSAKAEGETELDKFKQAQNTLPKKGKPAGKKDKEEKKGAKQPTLGPGKKSL